MSIIGDDSRASIFQASDIDVFLLRSASCPNQLLFVKTSLWLEVSKQK
jgi:hypothetical protein